MDRQGKQHQVPYVGIGTFEARLFCARLAERGAFGLCQLFVQTNVASLERPKIVIIKSTMVKPL